MKVFYHYIHYYHYITIFTIILLADTISPYTFIFHFFTIIDLRSTLAHCFTVLGSLIGLNFEITIIDQPFGERCAQL